VSPESIEVRRSRRRRRTVSAYREGGRTIVLIPAGFSASEEKHWVDTMLRKLEAGDRRRRPSDDQLAARAAELSQRYLGGLAKPTSIVWSMNQASRWGSCTPSDGSIRISARVKGMPSWVLDYVIMHELAHLLQPSHGRDFWALLESYPRTERARGYLEGVVAAGALGPPGEGEGEPLADDVEDQPLRPSAS
jgi:predicted metal-dependent hydrolase